MKDGWSLSNAGDGLVVTESGDVDSHDDWVLIDAVDLTVYGGFDVYQRYQGVWCVGWELSEDSDLVCRRFGSPVFSDVFGPFGGDEAGEQVGFGRGLTSLRHLRTTPLLRSAFPPRA